MLVANFWCSAANFNEKRGQCSCASMLYASARSGQRAKEAQNWPDSARDRRTRPGWPPCAVRRPPVCVSVRRAPLQ